MNLKICGLIIPALLLAACNNGGDHTKFTDAAVIATRAPDYSSGAVSLADVNAPYTAENNLAPGISDIFVRSGGDYYFVISRYGTDQISRYEASNPDTPVYTYSTQLASESGDSNPSDLIIVSDTKAYLLRYGSGTLWIVNPSASTEAGFKTGEIDLSQYDSDGVPDMTAGLLKDGKLYVAMQRLTNYSATQDSYIAVIDTKTDREVTTGSASAALKGIDLPIRNISSLVAVPGSQQILAVGPGDYGSYPTYVPAYDGGIVSINTTSYAATLALDDGDATTHPYGQLTDIAAVASDRAYFIGSTGFAANQTLYRFNPAAGTVTPVTVSGFANLALGGLAVDPNSNLWLSRTDASAPGITVLGFQSGSETVLKALIDTNLTPINVDFISVPQP